MQFCDASHHILKIIHSLVKVTCSSKATRPFKPVCFLKVWDPISSFFIFLSLLLFKLVFFTKCASFANRQSLSPFPPRPNLKGKKTGFQYTEGTRSGRYMYLTLRQSFTYTPVSVFQFPPLFPALAARGRGGGREGREGGLGLFDSI